MTTPERMTTKQIVLMALKNVSDDTDLDDVLDRIVFVHTLQRRLESIDQEPVYTLDEVEKMMATWQPSS